MDRTRAGLLAAALRSIARDGVRRTTMTQIGDLAGVAKATLYNHFRRKDDVVAALVDAEISRLATVAALDADLPAAFVRLADAVADHPALRTVVDLEPDLATRCMAPGEGAGWDAAREAMSALLTSDAVNRGAPVAAVGPRSASVSLALRWLGSLVGDPGDARERLACALLVATAVRSNASVSAMPPSSATSTPADSDVIARQPGESTVQRLG